MIERIGCRIYTGYTQDIHRIYTGYTQDIHRIYTGYRRDIHRIYTGYRQDIRRIYTGYTPDIRRMYDRIYAGCMTGCTPYVEERKKYESIIGVKNKESMTVM